MLDDSACLFCLSDTPRTKRNYAPCECKPNLHQRCLNKWYYNNPNECPICRVNYERLGLSGGNEDNEDNEDNEGNERGPPTTIHNKHCIMIFMFTILFYNVLYRS